MVSLQGLGAAESCARMVSHAESLCRRYVRNNLLKTDTQRCAMTTVSALMAQHDLESIDLLKIDVEGAELDVLHGIRPEDWPRIHQASTPACMRWCESALTGSVVPQK